MQLPTMKLFNRDLCVVVQFSLDTLGVMSRLDSLEDGINQLLNRSSTFDLEVKGQSMVTGGILFST